MKNSPFDSLVWSSLRLALITERGGRGRGQGKDQERTMAGPRSQARPRTRQGVSIEETEKLYNSWGEPERATH